MSDNETDQTLGAEKGGSNALALGEFDLIARFFAPLSDQAHGLGLTDDAACIKVQDGHELVITVDAIVENVHFLAFASPEDVGFKAVSVNVSDLIAKGAKPLYYLLTFSLSDDFSSDWVAQFAQGLKDAQKRYGCLLVGGDTVRTSGPLTISITMMGETPHGAMVKRSGAKEGDQIFVSGTIGDAVVGLGLCQLNDEMNALRLSDEDKAYFTQRYSAPEPAPRLGTIVREYATAAMDISDGLIGDLEKLCQASGQGADINLPLIPIDPSLKDRITCDSSLFQKLITGGDDYEVLMTVAPHNVEALQQAALKQKIRLTAIGKITDRASGISYYDESGQAVEFKNKSYQHF